MTAADAVARMLTLVPWLLERPGASLQEVADAFGVDVRTVRRDLEQLDFCGLPGLRGGDLFEVDIIGERVLVRMADELRRPLRLTPREALRLVLTIDGVATAYGDELPALRSAVDKVRQAAGVPEGVHVRLADDGVRWLPVLRAAIERGRRLRLEYAGRNDPAPVPREVDAWALHVNDGNWYLQGHDVRSGERRTFRLDRIAEVEEVGDAEVGRPEEELPPPDYVPGPDDVVIELLLGPAARWVADAARIDERDELSDGRLRVVFATDALRWVERLVLMGGGDVEVVRPEALARSARAAAGRALERYADV